MIHWLLKIALLKAENAAIYTLTAGLVTTLILVPFRAGLRKIWRAVDSLDPETDSGVTKELHQLDEKVKHALDSNSNQHLPRSPAAR